jgi:hypothetical protein
MKVTVMQGIRVAHDGAVYHDDATADVPERVARRWIYCGWASDDRTAGTLLILAGWPALPMVPSQSHTQTRPSDQG